MIFSRGNTYGRGVDRTKRRAIFGALIIIFTCFLIWFWMNVAQQNLVYTSVLALNKDIHANEKIEEQDIVSIRIPKDNLVKGVITDVNNLKGKEALIDIPKGMPLTKSFFRDVDMDVRSDQFVFAVPTAWIYSCPQTLRRGDEIHFYEIPSEEILELGGFAGESSREILKTTVMYVKDTANREVTDIGINPRYDGSSSVSNVEVAVTEAEYERLYNSFAAGNQFIILYN